MSSVSRRIVIVCAGCVLLGGGALSVAALGANGKHKLRQPARRAATTSTSTTTTSTTPRASNEDPAHEAGESAAREAQEGNGVPGGSPGGAFRPNEDAAHEAGESAAREAQEDAGQRPTVP